MKTKSNINLILTGLILVIFMADLSAQFNFYDVTNQPVLSYGAPGDWDVGFIANTFKQDLLELTFTAQNDEQHVSLDSIMIINHTQGGDTMLYAPDTILLLHYWPNPGINEHNLHGANSFSVSPNYPHPFIGQTFIDVCIVKTDNIVIRIFDLSGREHASYEGVLDAGKHTFTFYPGNQNFYIFSALYCGLTRSIKITNPLSGKADCKLTYKGVEKQAGNLKSHPDVNFPFSLGDKLLYIGYANGLQSGMLDAPETSDTLTFQFATNIPCPGIPTVTYEGQVYNTIQIFNQCWLKENLNVGTMIPGVQEMEDNGIIEKYCYDNNPANCNTYGGLYQWNEIMKYTIQEGVQGICPSGWHIPTDEEWKQLEGEVDSLYGYPDPEWDGIDYRGFDVGKRLKSQNSWWYNGNGNDFFGFSALATGARRYYDGAFLSMGVYTSFWSSTEGNSFEAWYRYLEYFISEASRHNRLKTMGRSVRCVMDY